MLEPITVIPSQKMAELVALFEEFTMSKASPGIDKLKRAHELTAELTEELTSVPFNPKDRNSGLNGAAYFAALPTLIQHESIINILIKLSSSFELFGSVIKTVELAKNGDPTAIENSITEILKTLFGPKEE